MSNVIVGIRDVGEDAVLDGGAVALVRNGLEEAASALAAAPVTNLRDGNVFTRWETANATPELTRVRMSWADQFGQPLVRQVGAIDFVGDAISDRGVVRALVDDRWTERPALSLAVSGQLATASTVSTNANLTIRIILRMRPSTLTGAAWTVARFGTADTDAGSDWRLQFTAAGALKFRVSRYSASGVVDFTLADPDTGARHDDSRVRELWLTISGTTAQLYLGGAANGASAVVNAHSSQTNQALTIGGGGVGGVDLIRVERWSVALSAAEIAARTYALPRAKEGGKVLSWDFSEGVGQALGATAGASIADDSGSGLTGTVGGDGGTWQLARNPAARVDTGAVPRWVQNWRKRPAASFAGLSADVQAVSAGSLTRSLSWTWAFTVTIPKRNLNAAAGNLQIRALYPAGTIANYEAAFVVDTAGIAYVNIRRGQSASTPFLTLGTLADGVEHFVVVQCDGFTNLATGYVDGVSIGSTAVTAYVAASSLSFRLGPDPSAPTIPTDFAVRGDMLWWTEIVAPADAAAWRYARHPGHRYERGLYLGYDFEEGSGSTIANKLGSASTAGDLTISGTVGVVWSTAESADPAGAWLSGRTSAEYSRHFAAPFAADVPASSVLLEVYDPRASSPAALRLGDFRVWEVVRPSRGTREIDDSAEGPRVTWTELGIPQVGIGPGRRRKVVELWGLTEAEAEALEHHLNILAGRDVLLAVREDAAAPLYRVRNAIRGLPVPGTVKQRRTGTAYPFSLTVTIDELVAA